MIVTEVLRRRAKSLIRKVDEDIRVYLNLDKEREGEVRMLLEWTETLLTAMYATPCDYSVAEDNGCFTVRKRVRTCGRFPYANIKRFHFTPSDAESKERARAAAHSLLGKLNEQTQSDI